MKRLLRWVFSLSALLSLCALGWLLLSPAAPPLLWRTLHWLLPGELQVAQSEGALLGTLQLRDIDYRLAQRHVSLRRLSWTLSRPALLRGELRFDALSLDGLHVDWPTAGSSSGFTPPTLSLPLPIELRHAQLTDLRIGDSTPEPLTLDRVTLVARAFAGQITLTLLEVERTPWRARLSGTLDLQRAAAMQLQGTLHGQWRDEPVTVDASLRGQFDELLAFSLDSTHPAQWRIAGTAQPATDRFDWQAQLELIALPGRLIGQPALALSGTAQLQGEGARATAELAMALSGLPLGPVQLQARTRLDDDLLDIDSARLHWGAGASVVTLRGRIADLWNDSRHLDLHGDWLDLGWPVAAPRLHSPAGQLHLTGDLDHYQATLSARLQAEPIGDSHWQLQLQGTPQRIELTRLGGELLQGQIDAQGSLDLAGRQFSMQSQLQRLDLSPLLQRKVIGSGLLTLSGHYGESLAELRLRLSDGLLDHGAAQHQLLIDAGWQPGAWQLDRLQLRGASSQLSARGRLGEQIDLDLSAHFADLGLWLADGAGTLSLQGKVQGHRQSPRIEFEGQGQRLRWRTWSAQQAETRLRLDLDPAAESRITLQADTLTGLGQQWPRLTLRGQGRVDSHRLQLDLLRDGHRSALQLEMTAGYRDRRWQGAIDALHLAVLPARPAWTLAEPVRFDFGRDRLSLEQACLLGPGTERACAALRGRFGGEFELATTFEAIALAPWTMLLMPDLDLSGTASGELHARLSAEHLERIDGTLRLSPGTLSRSTGQPMANDTDPWRHQGALLSLASDGQGIAASASLRLSATESFNAEARITPATPAPWRFERLLDSPLSGHLATRLADIRWIEGVIPQTTTLGGAFDLSLRLGGTVTTPRLSGALQLQRGTLEIARHGLRMNEIGLTINLFEEGDFRLTGHGRAGGPLQLQGSGRYRAPWRLDARLDGTDLRVSDLPETRVEIAPALQLTLQPGQARLHGQIRVPRAHVELRQSSPAVPASADVVIVGAQSPTPQPRWHLDSDLLIELGDRVEFKGHGFDGLVSGKLRLIDSGSAPPSGSGELRVDKGRFAIYGKQLDIERGRLLFAQSPLDDPAIDLLATRRHGELTVGVQGRGTAQTPRITLYASEPMAQSEILSWLVVGKPLSQVGQGDSDLLMGAASSAFLQGGELLSQWLGQRLGIGNVAIEQDDFSQQPWLTLGTQLSPRLHLGYYFGLMAGDNKVVLRYRLGRAWSLQGESGAASGADLLYSPR